MLWEHEPQTRASMAFSLCFRGVCEEDLDESFEQLVDLY